MYARTKAYGQTLGVEWSLLAGRYSSGARAGLKNTQTAVQASMSAYRLKADFHLCWLIFPNLHIEIT